jgi:branched-chain amino acid transport system ATP-binding protein
MSAETQAKTAASAAAETILTVNNIEVIYDHVILVLKGVSLDVPKGRIGALLVNNDTGNTTTLKAISNRLNYTREEVLGSSCSMRPKCMTSRRTSRTTRLHTMMEGRQCTPISPSRKTCSPARLPARRATAIRRDLGLVYCYFPKLNERKQSLAGYTSGENSRLRYRPRADVPAKDDPAR